MGKPLKANSVKIEGAKELRRRLSVLDAGFDDLKQLHEDLAKMVADTAANRAPVRTGNLRETIRASGTKTAGRVRAGFKSKAPYAFPIHFGWATRPDANKGWRGGPISPNPFLYDALDERRGEVLNAYFQGVKKIQRKAGL
jgi:hypothetical protein